VLTTQRIHDIVKQVTLDISGIPARGFTSRLEALIDELVSSLVPLMAAEESVLCDHVDHALGDALRQDHREVRGLVERLSMLSAGLDRRSLGATKKEPGLLAASDAAADEQGAANQVRLFGESAPALGGQACSEQGVDPNRHVPPQLAPPPEAQVPDEKPAWLTNSRVTSRASRVPPLRQTPPPPANPDPLK